MSRKHSHFITGCSLPKSDRPIHTASRQGYSVARKGQTANEIAVAGQPQFAAIARRINMDDVLTFQAQRQLSASGSQDGGPNRRPGSAQRADQFAGCGLPKSNL